jgi:predicted GNAT family N-acyltransferase
MNIKAIDAEDPLWNKTIEFAENCSWKAGPFFANDMKNNTFTGWQRVYIALEKDQIIGYCTFAKKDCIPDEGYSPFIGYIFVDEKFRGNRLSQKMIENALIYAKNIGFNKVYIVSGERGLYEKYGFCKVDEMIDNYGNQEQIFCIDV